MRASLFDIETVLITRRTVARRFRENDGAALFDLISNNASELSGIFPPVLPALQTPEEAESFARRKFAAWLMQESFDFAVWDKDNALLIGYAALSAIEWDLPKARLTAFIDKNLQSRGIMSEVIAALLLFAFQKLGIAKVTMEVSTENIPAQRLARKCGFIREGDLREEYRRIGGEPVDVLLYGITKGTFEKI